MILLRIPSQRHFLAFHKDSMTKARNPIPRTSEPLPASIHQHYRALASATQRHVSQLFRSRVVWATQRNCFQWILGIFSHPVSTALHASPSRLFHIFVKETVKRRRCTDPIHNAIECLTKIYCLGIWMSDPSYGRGLLSFAYFFAELSFFSPILLCNFITLIFSFLALSSDVED